MRRDFFRGSTKKNGLGCRIECRLFEDLNGTQVTNKSQTVSTQHKIWQITIIRKVREN